MLVKAKAVEAQVATMATAATTASSDVVGVYYRFLRESGSDRLTNVAIVDQVPD